MDTVKQSAALCLLKLMRTAPDCVAFGEWTARVVHLLNDQHMGVVTAAVSLIETLVKRNPDEYKGCVSLAVSRLSRVRAPFFGSGVCNLTGGHCGSGNVVLHGQRPSTRYINAVVPSFMESV